MFWHMNAFVKWAVSLLHLKITYVTDWNSRSLSMNLNNSVSQCTLYTVPHYQDYTWDGDPPTLGIGSEVQKVNASLAIQLCHAWMSRNDTNYLKLLKISKSTIDGLSKCSWPGRAQILDTKFGKFFFDGAHTTESMQICVNWFLEKTKNSPYPKVLIFNSTGDRDFEPLLIELQQCNFDRVIFVPNISSFAHAYVSDQTNFNTTEMNQMIRCRDHKSVWQKLQQNSQSSSIYTQTVDLFPTVSHALNRVPTNRNLNILVTGSLHLIGAVLKILNSELDNLNVN